MYDLGLSLDSSFSMLSQSPRCVAAFGGEDGDAHTPGVLSSPLQLLPSLPTVP